jgi:DNA replication protein DnaC
MTLPTRAVVWLTENPHAMEVEPQSIVVKRILSGRPGSLWGIFGLRGTGKTVMATHLGLCAARRPDMRMRYCTAAEINMGFDSGWGHQVPHYDALCDQDVLIVDEFGRDDASRQNASRMFAVLDRRFRELRTTILVGNASNQQEAEAILGPSICSRMNEDGGLFITTWPSHRDEARPNTAKRA